MKKCLIVDDVEVTRFTIEQIIAGFGLEFFAAATAEEAMDILKKNTIDVIFLDWHLRKKSGLDLLKEIKTVFGSRVRVVVFSGIEGPDKLVEAKQAGADIFLEKPTTRQKLEKCLKELGAL